MRQIWIQAWSSLEFGQPMKGNFFFLQIIKKWYMAFSSCLGNVPQIFWHFLSCFLHLKRETVFYSCQATPLPNLTPFSSPLQESTEMSPLELEIPTHTQPFLPSATCLLQGTLSHPHLFLLFFYCEPLWGLHEARPTLNILLKMSIRNEFSKLQRNTVLPVILWTLTFMSHSRNLIYQ